MRTVLEAHVEMSAAGPGMGLQGCKWHPPMCSIGVEASCESCPVHGTCTHARVGISYSSSPSHSYSPYTLIPIGSTMPSPPCPQL